MYPKYSQEVLDLWEHLPVFDINYNEAIVLLKALEHLRSCSGFLCLAVESTESTEFMIGVLTDKIEKSVGGLTLSYYLQVLGLNYTSESTNKTDLRHLWVEKLVKNFLLHYPATKEEKKELEKYYLLSYMPTFKLSWYERFLLKFYRNPYKKSTNLYLCNFLIYKALLPNGGLLFKIGEALGHSGVALEDVLPKYRMYDGVEVRLLWIDKLLGKYDS